MRKILLFISLFASLPGFSQNFGDYSLQFYYNDSTLLLMFPYPMLEAPVEKYSRELKYELYSDTVQFECLTGSALGTTPLALVGIDADGGIHKHSIASLGILPSTTGNEGKVLRVNSGGDGTEWATAGSTLTNTATLDFTSTAAGAVTDLTITVTGAAVGDVVVIGTPNGSVPATGCYFGWVSSTNTVTIRYVNNGLVSAVDPASGTFRATVIKP